MPKSPQSIYKVSFLNQGRLYEIYAKQISQPAMYGFIEVGDLVFGSNATLVVDPVEEKLKTEFEGVKKTYIPLHAIFRIDEVEKEGVPKIRDIEHGGNVTPFPMQLFTPPGPSKSN